MNESRYKFNKLTPINDVDLKVYEDALDFVFKNDDVKNVGISGAYGAGKSSVIETYKSLHPEIKFLHISLAYFQPISEETLDDEAKKQPDKKESDKNENVLEGKILNQLLHKIDAKAIPQTSFRVKREASVQELARLAFVITVFVMLLLYIIMFSSWSDYVSSISAYIVGDILRVTTLPVFRIGMFIACAGIFAVMLYGIIKVQFNKNIFKGISIQGNSIEIFEHSDESYFDKYLNEVLYLFEHSGADVIVFEDLDRYDTNQIFQRLREINALVNERNRNDGKILRFFYLIRDDLFISKERTKFFDFILPVVPVVDGSNAFDKFISHFKEGGIYDLFEVHFLQEVSLYIDDMRVLKNIYNEFCIYYNKINTTDLDSNKMLAMIIYKNIFPRDFSDLQLGRGFVHTVFSKKDEFIKDEQADLEEQIEAVKQVMAGAKKEHLMHVKEVDLIYDPKIEEMDGYYYNSAKTKEKKRLIAERDARKENIKNKSEEQMGELSDKLAKLECELTEVQNKKLCEIIHRDNAKKIFQVSFVNEVGTVLDYKNIKESEYFALIKYLIRNGYIDETYPDYMTYFYEDSISREDKIFWRSVTDEEAKEYAYSIKNPDKVAGLLRLTDFEKPEILNFDLLEYLCENCAENMEKLNRFIGQLKERKEYGFIRQYFENGRKINIFVPVLNRVWPEAFGQLMEECDFSQKYKKDYALASIYFNSNEELELINSNRKFSAYIENNNQFLDIPEPDISRIMKVFCLLEIRFRDIDYEHADKELFQEVYQRNLYVISMNLINLMLHALYGCMDKDDLKHRNYTVIMEKPEEPLARYVRENMNQYMESMLDNCEGTILDDEKTVILVLNDESLNEECKENYISCLDTVIRRLDSITEKTLWKKLLEERLVIYSRKNMLDYYFMTEYGLDEVVCAYINDGYQNSNVCNLAYENIDEQYGEKCGSRIFWAVVKSRYLECGPYAEILKSLNRRMQEFNITGIPNQNMDVLIGQRIIQMQEQDLLFMRDNYPHKVISFIRKNVKAYINNVLTTDNFEYDEMMNLLETDISDDDKIGILNFTDKPVSILSGEYSDKVRLYILQHNYDESDLKALLDGYSDLNSELKNEVESIVEKDISRILKEKVDISYLLCRRLLLRDSLSKEEKKQLFVQILRKMSRDECKSCMQILGMNDFLRIFEGKRPAVQINKMNTEILDIFKEKRWITKYSAAREDETMYRVVGRKTS